MKNLTQRLRFALKAFKTGQLIQPTPCEVIIVDDSDESFEGTLGITKERQNELVELFNQINSKTRSRPEVFHQVSLKCNHPNELAFCCMQLGGQWALEQANPLTRMMSLFNPK